MPPRYKQDALIHFYRLCWNAYERGPPGRPREGPKNKKCSHNMQNTTFPPPPPREWEIEIGRRTASRFFYTQVCCYPYPLGRDFYLLSEKKSSILLDLKPRMVYSLSPEITDSIKRH